MEVEATGSLNMHHGMVKYKTDATPTCEDNACSDQ